MPENELRDPALSEIPETATLSGSAA